MGWQQLVDMGKQNAQDEMDYIQERPVACPNDGSPLDTGPNGELHCPFGDWVWDGYNHLI